MNATDTTTYRTDEATGGTWAFYDHFVAFPHSSELLRRGDNTLYAEINVSLAAKDGGTHAEFAVCWYRFDRQSDKATPRLEAFGEAFAVLAGSGIIELLAGIEDEDSYLPDRFIADLEALGFRNDTAKHADAGPSPCPTCGTHGFPGAHDVVAWRRRIAAQV